jgi:hypothetical protein
MAAAKMPSISKMDAVRTAIKQLGKDAMPAKILEYVMAKFGLEMTSAVVYNYKSVILHAKKGKKPAAAKVESAPATAAVKAASASAKGSAVSLQDLAAVKGLVGRVGEDDLKSLIGILGG